MEDERYEELRALANRWSQRADEWRTKQDGEDIADTLDNCAADLIRTINPGGGEEVIL